MLRDIAAFHQDSEADWVAELSCGHRRHVRHRPRLSERPWVESAEGRRARLGSELDCAACDRGELPPGYEAYRRTPRFDEHSLPAGLQSRHTTKPGIWARIHVERGSIEYHQAEPFHRVQTLTPERPGTVLPEVEHHLSPCGPVSLHVEFWRPARERAAGPP